MKWCDFKQYVEEEGVDDSTEISTIDIPDMNSNFVVVFEEENGDEYVEIYNEYSD